ncbi:hypothetical protein [Corynebacterium senegalense]|uniref:hypothetical protein n=1 Tax=Corynebacterium senegalense TaxID=2080750 RepID=UPI000E1FDB23|nr:hypothetical protein [Corynebacterium senegalense]
MTPPALALAADSTRTAAFLPRLCHAGSLPSGAAFVSLSPGLACALAAPDGSVAALRDVGESGLTVHQAWNRAAERVLLDAGASEGAEFWVRPAAAILGAGAPPGLEARGEVARWLAHPLLFSALHRHFESLLRPSAGLLYLSPDCRRLVVVDAVVGDLPAAVDGWAVMRYSLGFPLFCGTVSARATKVA